MHKRQRYREQRKARERRRRAGGGGACAALTEASAWGRERWRRADEGEQMYEAGRERVCVE